MIKTATVPPPPHPLHPSAARSVSLAATAAVHRSKLLCTCPFGRRVWRCAPSTTTITTDDYQVPRAHSSTDRSPVIAFKTLVCPSSVISSHSLSRFPPPEATAAEEQQLAIYKHLHNFRNFRCELQQIRVIVSAEIFCTLSAAAASSLPSPSPPPPPTDCRYHLINWCV